MDEITQTEAIAAVFYSPVTGSFHRYAKTRPGHVRREATRQDTYGYLNISINGRSYKAHRLAWLYVHGYWPPRQIDHINGDRADNRICNLRLAGYVENGQNRAVQTNNTSGYTGVSWDRARGAWRAQICHRGQRRQLGFFAAPEDAYRAYLSAKSELHTFQPTPRMGSNMGREDPKAARR